MSFGARTLQLSAKQADLLTPPFDNDRRADLLAQSLTSEPPRLTAEVLAIKRVKAGAGVSYGHTFRTASATTLLLVAIGYGHGLPRKAGNRASVSWGCESIRMPIVGRVAMDVLVVDGGDAAIVSGEPVIFFGSAAAGEISITEWCESIDEHPFTVLACLDHRVTRELRHA